MLCFIIPKKLDAGCAPEDAHEQAMAAAAAAHREAPGGGRRNQEEIETLNRELREAQVMREGDREQFVRQYTILGFIHVSGAD